MRIHELTVERALDSLNSGPDGLSGAEAARRLAEYGPNRVEEVAREPLWLRFAREFTHFFAIILWLAAALAFTAEHFAPGEGMGRLGVAILGVILVNGLFSFWQEYKAERAVAALRGLLPQQVKALRAGAIAQLPAAALVPGDVVLLEEGDSVPADCRVIESFGLRVNNATVTGESLPKARSPEPNGEESVLFARNIVLAGTGVVSGQARAAVYATGMRTEFGRIARLTQVAGETGSPLQREIARLSRLVATLACGVGIAFFLIGQALGMPFWENFLFAIGIIVANVPEGLAPTVTLSLAMATQRMARRNALVRHLPAVETLGSTTVICCDKTGTLTENRMSVRRLWLDGGECDADELPHRPELQRLGQQLFTNAALCHNLKQVARDGEGRWLGDPMELALAACGRRYAGGLEAWERLDEIPFDTDRKRMSVLCAAPRARALYCKGALESVLTVCDRVQTADGELALDAAARARVLAAQDAMAARGLRVLAFAYRPLASRGSGFSPTGVRLKPDLRRTHARRSVDHPAAVGPQTGGLALAAAPLDIAAGAAVDGTRGVGDQAVAEPGGGIAPAHRLPVAAQVEHVAHAAAIAAIHAPVDLGPDQHARNGADHGAGLVGHFLADRRAGDAAQHRADRAGVTASRHHPVVALPAVPGIAQVVRVVLLAPAVGRRVRRGHRQRRAHGERQRAGQQRARRRAAQRESIHVRSPPQSVRRRAPLTPPARPRAPRRPPAAAWPPRAAGAAARVPAPPPARTWPPCSSARRCRSPAWPPRSHRRRGRPAPATA